MKKFSLLALAAAGLLLGACSDKDVAAEDNNQPINQVSTGENFIAVGINLPTTPASVTRANDNGTAATLDDGLEDEYKVKNATLFLFQPSASGHDINNDENATFLEAYAIDTQPWEQPSDPQVTETSRKVVQKVGSGVTVNTLALVILNNNGLFTFGAGSDAGKISWGKTYSTANQITTTTKFSDFKAKLVEVTTDRGKSQMWDDGFYMANAPLSSIQGSGTSLASGYATNLNKKFQTLVPIDHVYESEDAARAATNHPRIYVERGMAKVTLKSATPTTNTMDVTVGTSGTLYTRILGWVLDNTNKKSYNVRSTEGYATFSDPNWESEFVTLQSQKISTEPSRGLFRFTGNLAITEGSPAYPYRTYFSKDPNYNDNTTDLDQYLIPALVWGASGAPYKAEFGNEKPQYCFENTFDVNHQIEAYTTVARIAVETSTSSTFEQGTVDTWPVSGTDKNHDLYLLNGNTATVYDAAAMETVLQNAVLAYINKQGKETYVSSGELAATDITVGFGKSSTDGTKITVTSVALSGTPSATLTTTGTNLFDNTKTENATLIAALNVDKAYFDVTRFNKGISYYTIRIKHFGDDLTPWHSWEKAQNELTKSPEPIVGNVYPTGTAENHRNDNYLGRYGVLRNNWYDIEIGKISRLGAVTPEVLSNTKTDDELDEYIAFQIHVLSWAKRTQTWNF